MEQIPIPEDTSSQDQGTAPLSAESVDTGREIDTFPDTDELTPAAARVLEPTELDFMIRNAFGGGDTLPFRRRQTSNSGSYGRRKRR